MTIEAWLMATSPLVVFAVRQLFIWKRRVERVRTASVAQLAHALPPGVSIIECRADGSTLVVARHHGQITPSEVR